ncbi:MAG: hypothetical protein FWE29_00095 [Defluviitaleaceae bacterium]|nr:hypothetical protein [Defluviitaleaceae bacterium]
MSGILYTSKNRFYVKTDSGMKEYDSQKISKYLENLKNIKIRNEWKTNGTGAMFMGTGHFPESDDTEAGNISINGASSYSGGLVYSASLGELGGLYKKGLEDADIEGHVIASNTLQIHKIDVFEGSCAASIGDFTERHIAIFDLKTGRYQELTEGDTIEDYPSYSNDGSKIFFSSAGLAKSPQGYAMGVGPSGICVYCTKIGSVEELFESDQFNYIAPKEDKNGNLLFIKRPYRNTRDKGNIFLDILMFPIRIIRAIWGLLNYFSIAFGGESLRSGKSGSNIKAKQKSEKELFFEGNMINAEQELKANQRRGEKFPGIIPYTWELVRTDKSGVQTCLKKGVMDYTVCENGDIVYSNGQEIIRLSADGNEQLLEKCQFACNLSEI